MNVGYVSLELKLDFQVEDLKMSVSLLNLIYQLMYFYIQ
jgi:hypothetical protein